MHAAERPMRPLKVCSPRFLDLLDRQVIHGDCLIAVGEPLLSDPLLPGCAARLDPWFWAVHEDGAADGLGEPASERLATHGSRQDRNARVDEVIDRGVEAHADTSASVVGSDVHVAEV